MLAVAAQVRKYEVWANIPRFSPWVISGLVHMESAEEALGARPRERDDLRFPCSRDGHTVFCQVCAQRFVANVEFGVLVLASRSPDEFDDVTPWVFLAGAFVGQSSSQLKALISSQQAVVRGERRRIEKVPSEMLEQF